MKNRSVDEQPVVYPEIQDSLDKLGAVRVLLRQNPNTFVPLVDIALAADAVDTSQIILFLINRGPDTPGHTSAIGPYGQQLLGLTSVKRITKPSR
jgi:hypothetical protein